MATHIFPMRERMKCVDATAGTSWAELPFGDVPLLVPGEPRGGVGAFNTSDFVPLARGGAARSTAVPAFIAAIAAY